MVSSQPGDTLAGRVEQVLLRHQRGPLSIREIVRELGEEAPASATTLTAEYQLAQAIREDDLRRIARGRRARFVLNADESIRLRAPANSAEAAVEDWNQKVKSDLLEQLMECDPIVFEHIVAQLLVAIGYDDVRVTKRSNDGGIDVHAILSARGVTRVPTALQVKRWRKPVGRPEVQRLRGSLRPTEQGVLVTTSHFAAPAVGDAARQDANPVHLIDGQMLVDLMVEHGLGVQASQIAFLSLDEQLLTGGAVPALSAGDAQQISPVVHYGGQKFFLAQLPGGRSADYVTTLAVMVRLAERQPSMSEYIQAFQAHFPNITRADEARRRMRVLLSLGLAEIDSDHVILTFLGRRYLDNCNPLEIREAFLFRIAGAADIIEQVRNIANERERRQSVRAAPPAGLSSTQAVLVLRWLTQLRFI